MKRQRKEGMIRNLFFAIAFVSIAILLLILFFLVKAGVPIFEKVSVTEFIFGKYWYPTASPPDFGILPLVLASLFVTLFSAAIAVPLGVMTAIYIAEIASARLKEIVKPAVELLASLPSVVIGFFGMVVVAPFLQQTFDLPTGLNLFNASLMLAFMSVPIICTISEDAISSVPPELKEASLALGANRIESIFRVIIPASLSGISTGIILGMARAIGETMVVLMVAGGAAMIPGSLFDPVRPMPASIAAEMAEAPFQSDHYHALFAIGIILFVFNLVFNSVADYISHKHRQVGAATL
ncbi:MAG: phosphate ABC transporter permease subunit PstC [Desulfobacterales bacterium]|nr:phosphate ABC transporter permease subunit PstC [Desulfobacterales bacterium]MBS3755083.1 phosphate ABC transporter permease subunit PstC [Desulfobacterales bacterium]